MSKKISRPNRIPMTPLILAILAAAIPVLARPVIESAIYYTDFWYDNPLGWQTGHHFVACAKMQGSGPITVDAEDQKGTTYHCLTTTEAGTVGLLTVS